MKNNEMLAPPPKGLTFLAGIEPGELAAVLEKENKSVASTVLVNLDEERAVKVFNILPAKFAAECAYLMTDYSPVAVKELAEIHSDIFKKIKGTEYSDAFGNEVLIRLIKKSHIDRYNELSELVEKYGNRYIRGKLSFSFKDIYDLDSIAMSKVLFRAGRDTIIKAFKGTDRNFRSRILSAPDDDMYLFDQNRSLLPADEYDVIISEIDSFTPESIQEVLDARGAIVRIVYELDESGDIFVIRNEVEDIVF